VHCVCNRQVRAKDDNFRVSEYPITDAMIRDKHYQHPAVMSYVRHRLVLLVRCTVQLQEPTMTAMKYTSDTKGLLDMWREFASVTRTRAIYTLCVCVCVWVAEAAISYVTI